MRVMPRRSFRGAATVLALTTAALLGTAGAALACYPSDGRAPATPGNATTCEDAKVPGKVLFTSDNPTSVVKYTGGVPGKDKSVTITGLDKGVVVTAIVVKGGDGFNTYQDLGDLPWKDLISPKNGGHQVPTISHWFLCGNKNETPPETTVPTKPSKPTETAKPTETTSAPSTSDTATTSPAAPAGNESGGSGGGLANTGFDNGWLIGVAALLLLAGGGLLVLLRVRRKAGN